MRGRTVKSPELVAEARRLRAGGMFGREIAAELGVARSTVYEWLTDPDRSQAEARRDRYRGVCEECGGPTDGSAGLGRAPKVCVTCLGWTGEEIIAAVRRWADEHGSPPTATEWNTAQPGYPSASTVVNRLGWNEALLAAGLPLRWDRRPETRQAIERAAVAGEPLADIAARHGMTVANIRTRLRYHGVSARPAA